MKKLILLATISCVAVFTTFLFSCQKDACGNVKCQHGGTCANGLCKCPTGYEGNSCESRLSDKFVGTYIGADCDDTATYTLSAASNTTVNLRVPGLPGSMHASVSGNAPCLF
ncbi:MAG: calcium-binding EGF-like domain-containing protein [Bacteroidetes bacterium]|nr:calcium-binding EGF-like domain-containing protein [Bacteroidota bacterium]